MISPRVLLLGSLTVLLPGLAALSAQPQEKRALTVWDGVYSQAQATRGADVYEEHCALCHAPDLSGDTPYNPSPQLAGRAFLLRWEGKHLDELYTRICATMPQNKPGTLKPEQCADVMAFVFKRNQFPAGDAQLPADVEALGNVAITLQGAKK